MLKWSAVGQLSLDKDESCPAADLSNIGRPNGPAYSTGVLMNTPQMDVQTGPYRRSCFAVLLCSFRRML